MRTKLPKKKKTRPKKFHGSSPNPIKTRRKPITSNPSKPGAYGCRVYTKEEIKLIAHLYSLPKEGEDYYAPRY
jgi:hypothetical protein